MAVPCMVARTSARTVREWGRVVGTGMEAVVEGRSTGWRWLLAVESETPEFPGR
jgi:hypothetical protein